MANRFSKYLEQQPSTPAQSGNRFQKYLSTTAEQPEPEGRGAGGVVNDLWTSFAGGANALLKIAGDAYGLTTGDMDNWASNQGGRGREYWQERKSPQLKALEEQRKQRVDSAQSDLGKAAVAFWDTLSSPSLLTSFIFEQAPMLLPVGGVGRAASAVTYSTVGKKVLANAAEKGVTENVAKRAVSRYAGGAASRVGTGAAVGTGAVMQGSDAGSQAYEQLMSIPDEIWMANPRVLRRVNDGESLNNVKAEESLRLSRNAATASGIASVGLNMIPGARVLERTLAGGKALPGGRIMGFAKGFAGESLQEGLEEGSGALFANLVGKTIDETINAMEGVGEATGLGFTSGIFGGVAGALSGGGISETAKNKTNVILEADDIDSAIDFAASAVNQTVFESDLDLVPVGEEEAYNQSQKEGTIDFTTPIADLDADLVPMEMPTDEEIEQAYSQRQADLESQKDADYDLALQQINDQEIETGKYSQTEAPKNNAMAIAMQKALEEQGKKKKKITDKPELITRENGQPFSSQQAAQASEQFTGESVVVPYQGGYGLAEWRESKASQKQEQKGPVLQNRDRSSPASISQMTAIAKNPDYGRLGFSRDFANGAPVVDSSGGIDEANLGKTDYAVAADGRRIPVQYAVVEAETLLPSNKVDGTSNPTYAEGEPGKSRAIAGNGRIAGIQEAFNQDNAADYVQGIVEDAALHGIAADVVLGIKRPILVRVMPNEEITDDIGDISNTTGTAALSPSEQAKTDAARVDVAGITLGENGEITRQSADQFIAAMPQSERGKMMDGNQPGKPAYERLNNLLFHMAYESDELLRLQAEAVDEEIKSIMNALRMAAPKVAQLKEAGDYDIRDLIVEAAEIAVNAKRRGQTLKAFIEQRDLETVDAVMPILEMMADNVRSAKRMSENLSNLADVFYAEASRANEDMFGEVRKRTPDELMEAVYGANETQNQNRVGDQSRTEPGETGNVREAPDGTEQANAETDTGTGEVDVSRETYGKSNTLFTEEEANAARERLKAKRSQLNAGLDPEILADAIKIAGFHIEAGARSFAAFSKAMIAELGDAIKPYLRSLYETVRAHPGAETLQGMTAIDQMDIFADEPVKAAAADVEQETDTSITEKFQKWIDADWDRAVEAYSQIKGTEGGKLLDVDLAREMSPDYLADRMLAGEVHPPASAFIKKLFAKRIAETKANPGTVLFMAGGTGAGKSSSVSQSVLDEAVLILDGTMANTDRAINDIEAALAAGNKVQVRYVYREPKQALVKGAIARLHRQVESYGSGRPTNLDAFIKAHGGSLITAKTLTARYSDHPDVKVISLDNSFGYGENKPVFVDFIPDMQYNELEKELLETLKKEYENDRITEQEYQAFAGDKQIDTRAKTGQKRLGRKNSAANAESLAGKQRQSDSLASPDVLDLFTAALGEFTEAVKQQTENIKAGTANVIPNHNTRDNQGAGSAGVPGNAGVRGAGTDTVGLPGEGGPGAEPGGTGSQAQSDTGRDSAGQRGNAATAQPGGNDRAGNRNGADSGRNTAPIRTNYRITDNDQLGLGGAVTKARGNIEAIRIVKKLAQEKRPATLAEQQALVKYVGWGDTSLANNLFPSKKEPTGTWKQLHDELRTLLTEEELASAARSTQYAHFTSKAVIDSIYSAINNFGLTSGVAFEGGIGTGNFIGLIPGNFNLQYTGIEMDGISADIAAALYPEAGVIKGDFIKTPLPENHYDLTIGNPPFAGTVIQADPKYAKNKFLLHDYFIAKQIDSLRPGGIAVFVTSKGTMDKKSDASRTYLNERADLLGAIRLPQTAFKENAGTEVVTDILFFQKREAGTEPAGKAWQETKTIKTDDGEAVINEYFADNPDMILGKSALQGSMYGANEYTVLPTGDINQQLAEAVNKLPKGIVEKNLTAEEVAEKARAYDVSTNRMEGSYYLDDNGELRQVAFGAGQIVPVRGGDQKTGISAKQKEIIRDYIPLRDALADVYKNQNDPEALKVSQRALDKAYTAFVKAHGPINQSSTTTRKDGVEITREPVLDTIKMDPYAYQVATIEIYDELTGKGTKNRIFSERVSSQSRKPQINSAVDALNVVLNNKGYVDMDAIAELYGESVDSIIQELGQAVYRDPVTGSYVTEDEYLSGDVKAKLALARDEAENDKAYQRNVDALEKVQPEDIPLSRIPAKLGAYWIPTDIVQRFAEEVLGFRGRISNYLKGDTGHWTADGSSYKRTFSTGRRDAVKILEAALNRSTIKIYDKVDTADGEKSFLNVKETAAANQKMQDIKDEFSRWILNDDAGSKAVYEIYNRQFNSVVPRKFNGSHLTIPRLAAQFGMYPHAKNVVWRIIQTGNTYMAHTVGAGKTVASSAAAMELKRLGLVKKPTIAVLKSTLKQFATEFYTYFPDAKLLVADETQLDKQNLRKFYAKLRNEDWDAIIMTHEALEKIPLSQDFIQQRIEADLKDYRSLLENVDEQDRAARKQIERQIESMEQRLEKMSAKQNAINDMTFEETGIDMLFVDEAHNHKKIPFPTNQTGVKGVDSNGSQRAYDLYLKSQYLEQIRPGRGLVLMSGTPVTNTIGEVFNIQRYLQPQVLAANGTSSFDAWTATFADTVTEIEMQAGGNFKPSTRMMRFVGVPALMRDFLQVADVVSDADLNKVAEIKRPKVVGGQRDIVTVKRSPELLAYQKSLNERIAALEEKKGPPQKGEDNILVIINDAKKAAIDMRLVGGRQTTESKLQAMINSTYQHWLDTKDKQYFKKNGDPELIKGATQLIFLGIKESSGFNVYENIRDELVKRGIPKKQIAFIQDYNTSKKKKVLFKDVNAGRVRIVLGGSQNLGTGTNVQQRITRITHLDIDYLPANIIQREGRGIRQGNKNEEIEIKAFATEGTVDSFMWQLNETKQRMIDQIMSGDLTMDEVEDISDNVTQMAQAKALASGNPLLLEQAGIASEVKKLSSLREAHINQQYRARREIDNAKTQLARLRDDKKKIAELSKKYKETKGDSFSMKLFDRTFTDRKKAGTFLMASADSIPRSGTIGTIGGLNVNVYSFTQGYVDVEGVSVYLPATNDTYSTTVSIKKMYSEQEIDPVGLIRKLENSARDIGNTLGEKIDQSIDYTERDIASNEELLKTPFQFQKELDAKTQRLKELDTELQADAEPATETEEAPLYSQAAPPSSQAFKAWFGDSKVVDENGNPLVVYHSTSSDFNVFDTELNGGSHFGTAIAADQANKMSKNINYKIEEEENKFYVVPDNGDKAGEDIGEFATKKQAEKFISEQQKRTPLMAVYLSIKNPKRVEDAGTPGGWKYERDKAISEGYDGLVYVNEVEDIGSESWVAFYPNQIKSATGNRGTYSPDSNSILESKLQAEPGATGTTVQAVREAIASVVANLNADPVVNVVQSMDNLPDGIKSQVEPGGKYKGVYYAGDVYLIADNILNNRDARVVLAHELIGHKGVLEGATAEELAEIKTTIANLNTAEAQSIRDEVTARYGQLDEETAYKEFLAIAAERRIKRGEIGQLLAKVKEILRRLLKAMGFTTPFSDSELDIILSNSERYIRESGRKEADSAEAMFSAGYRTKKIASGYYEYRGYEISKTEDGHWNITPPGEIIASDAAQTLEESKLIVDKYVDKALFSKAAAPVSEFAEENRRLREEDKTLWNRAKTILRRELSPGGLLPESVFKEKIARDSKLAVVEFDAAHLIGELERAVRKDYGTRIDRLSDADIQFLSETLAGDIPANVKENTKQVLVAMRKYIDNQSADYRSILMQQANDLINQANATGDQNTIAEAMQRMQLMEIIASNEGKYVHRSYQAFDDANWFKRVPDDVLDNARRYLMARYLEEGSTRAEAIEQSQVVMDEILKEGTAYGGFESFIKESKLGAKDLSVLKKRKQIAPEIRALLGEYKDPRINFAKSATKMGRLIWNQRFLDKIREIGMGDFLFTADTRPAGTTKIAADGSEVYAPLNGLYTYREVNQAFKDALGKEQMANWYKNIVQINGMVKFGKAQPLDAIVYTPDGPAEMGDLKVGDLVCGAGVETQVIGIYPQGEMDVYKIIFSDGSQTEATGEHLWEVIGLEKRYTGVFTTDQIMEWPSALMAKSQIAIPVSKAIFNSQDVPVDPYILGILIGDGSFVGNNPKLSTTDNEIIEYFRTFLPDGMTVRHPKTWAHCDYSLVMKNFALAKHSGNILKNHLSELGLWGHKSRTKFIPDIYKYNSEEIRLNIIRGLLDSDGWVLAQDGQPEFSTGSKQLADDFTEVAESLGATVLQRQKITASGNVGYELRLRVENAPDWFMLSRKKEIARQRKKPVKRTFKSIQHVGKKQCQCIMVDDDQHLYLTDRFIVTHNTILSPTTAARNWQSAMFFTLANGHFDLTQMKKSVQGLKEYFVHAGSKDKLDYLRRLKELGVVYDTPYAGEMMRLLDDSQVENMLYGSDAAMTVKGALRIAQKFYQYGDDFWKIIGFENEKNMLMKHAGMSQEEAEIEAAERIRNTYPTYSMVGRGVQALRRFPLAGTFVSFPAEIIRTSVNIVKYLAKDMKNPKTRPMAMRRAAGLAIVSGFAYALQELSKNMFDIDDDDEEAVRLQAAPWQKNSNLIFTGRDENGMLRYIDISFLDPYNYWKRPINSILRDQPWQDEATSALSEVITPFFGTDILAGTIFQIMANKTDTGGEVYKETDSPTRQLVDIADYLRQNIQPGIASNLERTYKAMQGEVSGSGRRYNMHDEGLAWIGWRVSTLDPKTALYYRSFDFNDAKSDASRTLTEVLTNPNQVNDRDITDAYELSLRMRRNAYEDMFNMVSAAKRSGMSDGEIRTTLRGAGISRVDINSLIRGNIPRWIPTTAAQRNAMRRARAILGPEMADTIRDRYVFIRRNAGDLEAEQ